MSRLYSISGGECKHCEEKGFTTTSSEYTCSDCSNDQVPMMMTLCSYHGQKHAKKNPSHKVTRNQKNTISIFGGSTSNNTAFGSSSSLFGSSSNNSGVDTTNNSSFGFGFGGALPASSSTTNSSFGFGGATNTVGGGGLLSGFSFDSIPSANANTNTTINTPSVFSFTNLGDNTGPAETDENYGNFDMLLSQFMSKRAHMPVQDHCKLILVGDGAVGKTSFTQRILNGQFDQKYLPTVGVQVSEKEFETTGGNITFKIWDTAGQERFGGLRDGYFINGQCAIIMFDSTSEFTFKNAYNWHRDVTRVCENIPIVLCANRVDMLSEEQRASLKSRAIQFCWRRNVLNYFEVSSKDNLNLEDAFEYLAKVLLKNSDVSFVSKLKRKREESIQQNLQQATTNQTISDTTIKTVSEE